MPFISVDFDSAVESSPVKAGIYELVIASVEQAVSNAGKPQLIAHVGIEGHDDAPMIRQYISLIDKGDDADKAKFKTLLLKRFCRLFNVPFDSRGFDSDSMVGAHARAELTLDITEKKDPATGQFVQDPNAPRYNRIVVPRLADEGDQALGARTAPKPPKS